MNKFTVLALGLTMTLCAQDPLSELQPQAAKYKAGVIALESQKSAAMSRARQSYLAVLGAVEKSATDAGQLSIVSVLTREREAVNGGQMPPTMPAGLPMAVQSARKACQAEVARITSTDAVMQQRMAADYLRVLSALQPRAAGNAELARQLAAEKSKVLENRPRPDNVPPDARRFNGKWYRLCAGQCSWKTARDRCARAGGQLAIIPDEATQVFIRSLTTDAPSWLGAYNVKGNHGWRWVDGTPMTFSAWGENQPDNWGGNQHYLQIIKGSWDDTEEDRDDIFSYICEWKDR